MNKQTNGIGPSGIIPGLPSNFSSSVLARIMAVRLEKVKRTTALLSVFYGMSIAIVSLLILLALSSLPTYTFEIASISQHFTMFSQVTTNGLAWVLPAAIVSACLYLLDGALENS